MAVYIFLGAGSGGLLRHWVGGVVRSVAGEGFPFGTMLVNISGCFALGLLATLWSGPGVMREEVRAAAFIGVLGGYTTFSGFSRETLQLAQSGAWGLAAIYSAGSVVLGLAGMGLGMWLAGRFVSVP